MKYIKTYSNLASYNADKENFEYPHVSYIISGDSIIYDSDEPASWKTVTVTSSDGIALYEDGEYTVKIGNDEYYIDATVAGETGDYYMDGFDTDGPFATDTVISPNEGGYYFNVKITEQQTYPLDLQIIRDDGEDFEVTAWNGSNSK